MADIRHSGRVVPALLAALLAASGGALAAGAPQSPGAPVTDPDHTTALHWAVYRNDVAEVTRLIKSGADVNARNDYGATPLSEAAITGNVAVIGKLLSAGAEVDGANADGQTALMVLARTSNVEAAKLLIKHGADVNRRE